MVDPSLIRDLQAELCSTKDESRAKAILQRLKSIPMTLSLLRQTLIAKSVKKAKKAFPSLKPLTKSLIREWRKALTPPSQPENPVRKSVYELFLKELGSEKYAKALEEELYKSCEKTQYSSKARSVKFNLVKNGVLKERLLAGGITCRELAGMSTLEMATESTQKLHMQIQREQTEARRLDWNAVHNEPTEGLFECPNCSSKWTLTNQKQILNADEPMTLFIQCIECSASWQC